jgi:hypothetical protein
MDMSNQESVSPSPELRQLFDKLPEAPQKPNEITLPTDKVSVINVEDLKPNSILIIKIDVPLAAKQAVAPVFATLLKPHAPKLREKNVTVMLMLASESLDVVSEEEMNAAGWEKKAKSLIINPYQK